MHHALGHVTLAACLFASLAFPPDAYSIEADKKGSGSGQVAKPDTSTVHPAEGTTTGAIRGRPASSDERWEMKPNPALKAGTGRITVNVPGNGKMIFTVVPVGGRKHEKPLMSIYGSGAGNFKPGQYDVLLWDSRVTVPVEAGADTRVKVGILSTEGVAGSYKVYSAAGGGEVYSGSTAGRVVLPAGRYSLRAASGAEGIVTIQDGVVTRFAKGGLAGAQTADVPAGSAKSTPPPPVSTAPEVVIPAGPPDLIPVTDGGKRRKFESRWEWRHAFWAKNVGASASPPSKIRLKFYYMDVTEWKLHADLVLDVPRLKAGEESKALVTRLVYRELYLWDVPSGQVEKQGNMHGYKWEFWVDSTNVVKESNEENNSYSTWGHYPHHGALETGPSGGFH